jgi:hypothetical protein
MATWDEIERFLGGTGMSRSEAGNYYMGSLKLGERQQTIFALKIDLPGDHQDMVLVLSPFAKKSDISAEKAIEIASPFAIADLGEWWVTSDMVPIANFDESEFWFSANTVGGMADVLEQKIGGGDNF